MLISYDESDRSFLLQTPTGSYAFRVLPSGYVAHLHWGGKIRGGRLSELLRLSDKRYLKDIAAADYEGQLDLLPQEYPSFGTTDFRPPAFLVQLEDGSRIAEAKYRGHRIVAGKPALEGLPAVYAEGETEAETLVLDLADEYSGLNFSLSYTVFRDYDAICRSVTLRNSGTRPIQILRAMSLSIDMPEAGYDVINLSGSWGRERMLHRQTLSSGRLCFDSTRGSSSHQMNPFVAMARPGCGEEAGEVYGFNLVYSGNFLTEVEVDQFDSTRVNMGINPFTFAWTLEPGQAFQTPEAVMVYSESGLGGLSRSYHSLYRKRLCRGRYRDRPRPVLVNNWEATYFDFNAEKILKIAKAGADLGIELLVLDDGWFGKRDTDNCSLGDWVVDKKKLPEGLGALAREINGYGMGFGLWIEPEMISPDSDLYRQHPDWCLHVQGRRRTQLRNQLVLDLGRAEVREYLVKTVSEVLSSAPISYVKWDMNRPMTEANSAGLEAGRQNETSHRYILGVYEIMGRITGGFPDVLFESCAGGGARFDPGLLYYMPQAWTSDDSDAIERLKIQWGTSIAYPPISMGAHVSAVPNHQLGRNTPLATRANVAMSGNFGYELDLTKFGPEEKVEVRAQVARYKELRHLLLDGDFYRLRSPFEGNECAWMLVSPGASEAFLVFVRVLAKVNAAPCSVRLRGLDPNADYSVEGYEIPWPGDRLMKVGLPIPSMWGDFQSCGIRLRRLG